MLAGGVESMSRVPMGSDGGAWAMDPETAYATGFVPQGIGADLIATLEGFTREDVDAYAVESQTRAAKAWANGCFAPLGRAGAATATAWPSSTATSTRAPAPRWRPSPGSSRRSR